MGVWRYRFGVICAFADECEPCFGGSKLVDVDKNKKQSGDLSDDLDLDGGEKGHSETRDIGKISSEESAKSIERAESQSAEPRSEDAPSSLSEATKAGSKPEDMSEEDADKPPAKERAGETSASQVSEINVSEEISLTEHNEHPAADEIIDDAFETRHSENPFDEDEEGAHVHPGYYQTRPAINSLERYRWPISAFMFTSILSLGVLASTFPVYNTPQSVGSTPQFSVVSDVDVTGDVPPTVIQTLRRSAGYEVDQGTSEFDRQRLLDLLDSRIRGVERNNPAGTLIPQSHDGEDLDEPKGWRDAKAQSDTQKTGEQSPDPKDLVHVQTVKCEKGDTLTSLLSKAGVKSDETSPIISALSKTFDPRHLRAGQEITFTFQKTPKSTENFPQLASADLSALPIGRLFNFSHDTEEDFQPRVLAMDVHTDPGKFVRVKRVDVDSFMSAEMEAELFERDVRVSGTIDSSLFLAAQEQGVPASVIVELIRMYSYDVDFQRQIRKGDGFEIFYKKYDDADGNTVRGGDILYGSLILKGKQYAYYSFTTPDDNVTDYYDENGVSAKKFLMKTPVDGARLTSRFGMRKHPISGYSKMHKGMDFAAPRGTPVMAAGNGTVEVAKRFGGYGNYIRIRHANGYKTAYAHLKGYARGIKSGARVKQGEVIGYIGSTGRSTGPHLHYEVHHNGKHINPASIRIPSGRALKGEMLAEFKRHIRKLNVNVANLPRPAAKPMAAVSSSGDEHRG